MKLSENWLRTFVNPSLSTRDLAHAITVLARAYQDATWRRTRTGNQSRSLLREYYPTSDAAMLTPNVAQHSARDANRNRLAVWFVTARAGSMSTSSLTLTATTQAGIF